MCKFCDMIDFPEDRDMTYGESDNWICIGDKKTGNPYIIYKEHIVEAKVITPEEKEEAKVMFNLLQTKYWNKMKLTIDGETYPHVHLIIKETK